MSSRELTLYSLLRGVSLVAACLEIKSNGTVDLPGDTYLFDEDVKLLEIRKLLKTVDSRMRQAKSLS
jgi:hypothetical protein